MGKVYRFRRRRRAGVPALVAGLLLALAAWQAPSIWAEPATPAESRHARPAPPPAADPWTESRRSADILRGQEGAPARAGAGAQDRAARSGRQRVGRDAAVRVIDGDTIDVDGVRIRLLGIDTPETHPPRCRHEAELGARATRRLEALLAEGEFELVANGRDEDRYGRKLRDVVRNGESLGAVLVREGLARPYGSGRRPWC
jgi:endonuclease YncB( thermonuclease family)